VNRFGRFSVSLPLLRRLALASVVANVVIVVTGGAVRLTGSGLGCPTWPRCTDESYTTTPALGINGAIEFGNRTLTGVVGFIALAGLVAALAYRPVRRSLVLLAVAVLLGIAAQAVIGGISVRMHLHPLIVGIHFIVSMLLLLSTYAFWRRSTEPDGPIRLTVPRPARTLAWLTTAVAGLVIVVGVLVTGSGPHAGDQHAKRNGLDPQVISQFHADLVFLLVGLTVGLLLALRAAGAPAVAVRAAAVLLAVELSQGLIGVVQYLTNLQPILVGAHMLGACLVWLATLSVLWATRERQAAAPPADRPDATASRTPAPALSR
jgi:cytochrome c oxidase assembly protein subunit 15